MENAQGAGENCREKKGRADNMQHKVVLQLCEPPNRQAALCNYELFN
jgi:hypothetical protein